jgi:hypothetical protein
MWTIDAVDLTALVIDTTDLQAGASSGAEPGNATSFVVSAPAATTHGIAFLATVTAHDASGNVATGYAGTVHFTTTGGSSTLPANSTLASGTASFSIVLNTTGSQTVTATDTVTSSINGTSGAITVS